MAFSNQGPGGTTQPGIMQRLGNAWNTISSNANQIGGVIEGGIKSLQAGTNPVTKQAQLANQAQPTTQGVLPQVSHVQPTQQPTKIKTTDASGNTTETTYPESSASTAKTLGDSNSTSQQQQIIQNQINSDKSQLTSMGYNSDGTPITGQTPNQIAASQPNPTSTMSSTAQNSPTSGNATNMQGTPFQQSTQGLLNIEQGGQSPAITSAQNAITGLNTSLANQEAAINSEGGGLGFATGAKGVLQAQYNQELPAYQQALQTAQTAQGQQISAGQAAAGATAPQLGQYGQTYYQPTQAGQNGGGGNIQLTGQASTDVGNLAAAVNNGTIAYNSALSQLSGYGTAVANQLLPAIQKINPQFSINASNASQQTTAVGQQIQTAASATNQALDTLSTLFSNLSPAQTAGIPATNSISNWIAGALGDKALSAYKTNLADARSQLIGVLNSAGGTPTGNEATANEYLPDNMTKQQFDTNVGTTANPGIVRKLIAQKVASFTSSGSQSGTSSSGTMFGNFNG